ncbi:zinc finger and BTB domain-containing protein 5 [Grus japonensis]|uniref:Zinc finger and BTB domain-containing protein 5 n=1 Tax=Grus japonensis TaxID=30415 RepID=A0ABC9WZD7_GRUJA
MEKTMVKQAVALQPMEDDGEQRFHLQPMEDPIPERVEAPEGGCDPWEAHAGADSWQDLWPCGQRSPHWSRFADRTCDPVGNPCWSSLVLQGLHPMERTHTAVVCKEQMIAMPKMAFNNHITHKSFSVCKQQLKIIMNVEVMKINAGLTKWHSYPYPFYLPPYILRGKAKLTPIFLSHGDADTGDISALNTS